MNLTAVFIIIIVALVALFAVVCLLFYKIVRRFFDNEQKKSLLELKALQQQEALKIVNPIRLQAYERMALFLERISPNSLVMRCYVPGMDIRMLQTTMTGNIRDEWEHNLSQQVYLSSECWSHIREAKDEMVNLINASASRMAPDADPVSLASAIFQNVATSKVPTDEALEQLRKELQAHFE
ncbi:MAG: hypothetical protein HUK17_02405 [Bacteroidales bacterium]|nr:hypothetical protein [Bacteroidales bacterium]